MRHFFLGTRTFKLISTLKYFTYITARMTKSIDASIFVSSFNLERTSLSLVFLDFEKLSLVMMMERYEFWMIIINVYGLFAEFHTFDSVLDDT